MICGSCLQQLHEECKGGTWCDCQHRVADALKPVAGDEYNGFTLLAYDQDGQAYRMVLSRDGQTLKTFDYPKYSVWTLLAHWREFDEVNP